MESVMNDWSEIFCLATHVFHCLHADLFNQYRYRNKGSILSREEEDIGDLANTRAAVVKLEYWSNRATAPWDGNFPQEFHNWKDKNIYATSFEGGFL